MNSAYDAFPPEIQKLINPKARQNEVEYWRQRDQLLVQYKGRWIGFADGKVVAKGKSAVAVFHEAMQQGGHPYVTRVGHEDEPARIRTSTFTYDTGYAHEPLPMVSVEFRRTIGVSGVLLHDLIADTGADVTALTWGDAQTLNLDPADAVFGWIGGVTGGAPPALQYDMRACLDGQEHPCRLNINVRGTERLLGRDVMNRFVMTFDGPAGEVIVNA